MGQPGPSVCLFFPQGHMAAKPQPSAPKSRSPGGAARNGDVPRGTVGPRLVRLPPVSWLGDEVGLSDRAPASGWGGSYGP